MIAFATAEEAIEALYGGGEDCWENPRGAVIADTARSRIVDELTALRAENARLRAVVETAGVAIGHAELWVDPLGIITWRPDAETTCKALFEYRTARAALDAKEGET